MMNLKTNPSSAWCRDFQGNTYTWEESLGLIKQFHGHTAPGLAIGVAITSLALEQMEAGTLFDVICETRSCLPDAVQMLTPCTIGNGWLKIKDLGRYALVMYDKFTGQRNNRYLPGMQGSLPPVTGEDLPWMPWRGRD